MKKNLFIIDKKIIINDDQKIAIKGGTNNTNLLDLSIGCDNAVSDSSMMDY